MSKLFGVSFLMVVLSSAMVFAINECYKSPVKIFGVDFEREIAEATKPVILYVYAPQCGWCSQTAPIFEELAKEMGDEYLFAKLDVAELPVDEMRVFAKKYSITSVPTFLFIHNNIVEDKVTGYMNKEVFRKKIEMTFVV